jgi:hypothetical protein
VLFGVEGLQVTDAQVGPDGTLEVWAVTDYPAAAACPDCRAVSARRHDTVLARPRDVRRAGDLVAVWWVKSRWKCGEPGCARKTFTEWLPQVPPRCRLTARLREQASQRRGLTVTPGQPDIPAHLRTHRLTHCANRPSSRRSGCPKVSSSSTTPKAWPARRLQGDPEPGIARFVCRG